LHSQVQALIFFPNVHVCIYNEKKGLAEVVPQLIYESSRCYRKDRFAIFGDYDILKPLKMELDADFLDIKTDYHWSGIQRRTQKHWRRIILGDYVDWFSWCMRWQRFRAFHTIVLIKPIQYMLDVTSSGYIDGFLTRLMNKPLHRVIVLEESGFLSVANRWIGGQKTNDVRLSCAFQEQEIRQAILSILYGTRLSMAKLKELVRRTIWSPRTMMSKLWRRLSQN
jgi:hypothetical protein